LDGKIVDFGECYYIILPLSSAGNGVDDVSSLWKMDVQLWNEKKVSFLRFLAHQK
jgi:hypothetical protein